MLSSVMSRLNDRRDAAADLGEDAGFTLIELMVVLLILAILLAIAIPTFLGVTGGANDKAAQSNLNTALTTAKTAATQAGQTYNPTSGIITAAALQSNEPSISFVAGAVTTPGPVSVYVDPGGNGIILASYSKGTNTCWYAVDNLAAVSATANTLYLTANSGGSATSAPTKQGDWYGKVTEVAGTTTTCDATATALQTTTGISINWGPSFSAA